MRQLTKSEASELEDLKIQVLSNLDPMSEVNEASIFKALSCQTKVSADFKDKLKKSSISLENMTMDSYKKAVVRMFVEHFYS